MSDPRFDPPTEQPQYDYCDVPVYDSDSELKSHSRIGFTFYELPGMEPRIKVMEYSIESGEQPEIEDVKSAIDKTRLESIEFEF